MWKQILRPRSQRVLSYYGRIGQRQRFHEPMLRAQQFQRLWKLRYEGLDSDADGTSAFLAASYIPRSTSTSPKLAGFPRSFSLNPFYSNEFENDNDSSQQQPTRMSQILYPFSGGDRCAVSSDMLMEGVEGYALSTYTNGGAYSSSVSSNFI